VTIKLILRIVIYILYNIEIYRFENNHLILINFSNFHQTIYILLNLFVFRVTKKAQQQSTREEMYYLKLYYIFMSGY